MYQPQCHYEWSKGEMNINFECFFLRIYNRILYIVKGDKYLSTGISTDRTSYLKDIYPQRNEKDVIFKNPKKS